VKTAEWLKGYLEGVRLEFKKITWPPPLTLRQLTIFVLILVLILALFAEIVDALCSKLIQLILK